MTRTRVVHLALLLLCCTTIFAETPPPRPAAHSAPAGEAAWTRLLEGNRQFIKGEAYCFDDIAARRVATAVAQSPHVTVVACADSRVGPELLFRQSLGDLFIVRTAGNVVDDFAIASLEYAAVHEWTDLIVVLGHSSCGAVDAALRPTDPPTPALQMLVNRIRESFVGVNYSHEPTGTMIRTAAEANARHVVSHISAHSPALRERIRSGRIQIVAAFHDLATGVVTRVP